MTMFDAFDNAAGLQDHDLFEHGDDYDETYFADDYAERWGNEDFHNPNTDDIEYTKLSFEKQPSGSWFAVGEHTGKEYYIDEAYGLFYAAWDETIEPTGDRHVLEMLAQEDHEERIDYLRVSV